MKATILSTHANFQHTIIGVKGVVYDLDLCSDTSKPI